MQSLKPILSLAAALALATTPVLADPYVEGSLELELGADFGVASDDPGNEITDLFATGALAAKFGLNEHFAFNLGLTFEAVDDPLPFQDRYFGDMGLYVDTLNVEVEYEGFGLVAGKFGPGFGTAWDVTPGIYSTDFAEDYELAEQIGFGIAWTLDAGDAGKHRFGANAFFADTTFLSDSAFTRRGRNSTALGGVGNTGRLDNVSLTVDGSEIAALPGFTYHIGFRHLSAGITETADENGFVFGIAREVELANGMTLGANAELAWFDNAAGVSNDTALYATAGVSLKQGPWHGELAGTIRNLRYAGLGTDRDHIVQASAGYEFDNGIDISAGYAHVREAAVTTHVVGFRLTKTFEYSTRDKD